MRCFPFKNSRPRSYEGPLRGLYSQLFMLGFVAVFADRAGRTGDFTAPQFSDCPEDDESKDDQYRDRSQIVDQELKHVRLLNCGAVCAPEPRQRRPELQQQ